MIPRYKIPVVVFNCEVTPKVVINHDADDSPVFRLVNAAGDSIAACASAKRLSDYAFENGALEVRHDYDSKLSDSEP